MQKLATYQTSYLLTERDRTTSMQRRT